MVAAKMADMRRGRPKKNPSIEGISQAKAAEKLNVGIASVERAKEAIKSGDQDLVAQVERGEKTVHAASLPACQQPHHEARQDVDRQCTNQQNHREGAAVV